MFTSDRGVRFAIAALIVAGVTTMAGQAQRPASRSRPVVPQGPGLGVPATEALVAAWDVSIPPDGTGLPPGSGSPAQGAQIFNTTCSAAAPFLRATGSWAGRVR